MILYLHGGGYAIGSIDTHRALAGSLSRAAQARVLQIGYRLAPEHPFPAAVEDSMAAYRWLLRQGVEPCRIVVAGDSAGGGLTVATLVALRDARERLPAAGVCVSPWVDIEASGESMTHKAAEDPMIQRDVIEWFASHYVGKGDRRAPLASPIYADLSGLSPLYVLVATAETLLDDSREDRRVRPEANRLTRSQLLPAGASEGNIRGDRCRRVPLRRAIAGCNVVIAASRNRMLPRNTCGTLSSSTSPRSRLASPAQLALRRSSARRRI